MNRLLVILFTFVITLFCTSVYGYRNGFSVPLASLDETETSWLVFMREEEKLARDTYITLYGSWGQKVFSNISSSEQRHMDTMLFMLDNFEIEDPVPNDTVGTFSDDSLELLYQQLISRGNNSLLEALHVGAYVEEKDISDLQQAIAATDEPMLINSYSNLLAASRNHLRTFVGHIVNLGVDYQAQYLTQIGVDDIVGDYNLVPGENFTINAGLNDTWHYPATKGQGFFITVLPDEEVVFMAWFTYDTELPGDGAEANLGYPEQRWMTAQGGYSGGQASLVIDFMSGGIFDSVDPVPEHNPGGSILLQFDDCESGSVTYDIPSINRVGVVPIVRVTPDNIALCEQLNAISQ